MRLRWQLLGKDLGESFYKVTARDKAICYPSILYFCKTCGSPWAKIDTGEYWLAVQRKCPEHGPGFLAVPKEKQYVMPEEVLKREIDLMLNFDGNYEFYIATGGV